MRGKIVIVCVILFYALSLVGCQSKGMDTTPERVIINEEFIQNADSFSVIDPLWWNVSIYDGEEKYYEDLEDYSVPQKCVFAIQWYFAEVNNGGHDQFFYNSTGIVWEDALNGFKVIGLEKNYGILKDAVNRIGGNPSKDRFKRQELLEEYEPDFDNLDSMLYLIETEAEEGLINYIRNNLKDFLFDGIVNMPNGF